MKRKYVSFVMMLIVLSFGVKVEAAVVSYNYTVKVCRSACITSSEDLHLGAYKGKLEGSILKEVNFLDSNNNIKGLNFVLANNEKVFLQKKQTTGSWFSSGGYNDSPPSDGLFYRVEKQDNSGATLYWYLGTSIPQDVENINIQSSNPDIVSCSDLECTALKGGTSDIKITFGSSLNFGKIEVKGRFQGTKSYVDSFVNRTYSFPSITYTITVPGTPNTPQVSVCTGASGITKDSATVNWSYTDVDNDPQTQYQVQLSTKSFIDATFTNADIVFASSSASANTSHTFTGLTPNTTYYARIKTQNAANGWSTVYSTCNAGFKTLVDENTSQPTCACNSDRDYVCKKTDGTVTFTDPNSSQCNFASYCSVATTTTTTTFTFGPTGYRIGNVQYEHSTDAPVIKTGPYDYSNSYTVNKVEGTQTFTATLTDLGDGTTLPPKTCSVTNASVPSTPPTSCTTAPCDTTIKITKKPAITLNKGGRCTLDWTITNRPTDMTCTLNGTDGTSKDLPDNSGTHTSGSLQKNTKYTISCTGGTSPAVSKSAVCRVNPTIGEI